MHATPLRRITHLTLGVLSVLLRDDREWYGLNIAHQLGVRTGSVYVVLARLEKAGWVTSRWENPDKHRSGAARKFYSLTAEGRGRATTALYERQKREERAQRQAALLARANGEV